jgi:hypothetical protein
MTLVAPSARSKNRRAALTSRRAETNVDDLAELVDRAVHVPPLASDLHVGLIDLPAVDDGMAAGPGGLGQQRRKPQHPPIDRDVVDLDAAFGEQLLDVAVRQRETQVPADRQHDHIRREAETGEGGPCNGIGADAASSHDTQSGCSGLLTADATAPVEGVAGAGLKAGPNGVGDRDEGGLHHLVEGDTSVTTTKCQFLA